GLKSCCCGWPIFQAPLVALKRGTRPMYRAASWPSDIKAPSTYKIQSGDHASLPALAFLTVPTPSFFPSPFSLVSKSKQGPPSNLLFPETGPGGVPARITMYNSITRIQNTFGLFTTAAFVVALFVALSDLVA